MKQQLREAQAEVQRLSNESTHWQVMLKRETEEVARLERKLQRERIGVRPIDEVRSEVERLKLAARLWADDIDAVANAYRRGAEAMREACEAAICAAPEGSVAELVIRALPIPEEP
jgi:hypothetical protein